MKKSDELILRKRVASRLRKYRLMAGYSQVELADKARIQRALISFFENEVQLPSLPSLVSLSRALRIPLDKFCE